MKKILIFTATIISVSVSTYSCKKDKATDNSLYNEITSANYSYYKSGNILSAAAASPHGSFKLKINALAQSVLDSNWKVINGKTFPDGAIIVKEIYDGSNLSLYAIMKKDANHKDAGSGWVWSEIKPGGSVAYSTGKKGSDCITCHNGSPNHDLVRTFDLH
ncbi:MAG: hypothetical protein RL065_1402 [Bacteroidota bacterium]|jgi:hypothetical protein